MKPGYYRHFKGHYYHLIDVATHSETGELMVVYRALYGERKLWVRPASMWDEIVDLPTYHGPRFLRVNKDEIIKERELVGSKKGQKWTKLDEQTLVALFKDRVEYGVIADKMKRSQQAIIFRLQMLGYLRYDKQKKEMVRIK